MRILIPAGWAGLMLVCVGMVAGCGGPTEKDLELRIYDVRARRTSLVDELYYEAYERGAVPKAARECAESTDLPEFLRKLCEGIEPSVEEADRALFEVHLGEVGRGERPRALTREAREFFARRDVQRRARRVVELELEAEQIESELRAIRRES